MVIKHLYHPRMPWAVLMGSVGTRGPEGTFPLKGRTCRQWGCFARSVHQHTGCSRRTDAGCCENHARQHSLFCSEISEPLLDTFNNAAFEGKACIRAVKTVTRLGSQCNLVDSPEGKRALQGRWAAIPGWQLLPVWNQSVNNVYQCSPQPRQREKEHVWAFHALFTWSWHIILII